MVLGEYLFSVERGQVLRRPNWVLRIGGVSDDVLSGWGAIMEKVYKSDEWKKAMEANDKIYEAHIYPGVNHGFHNDTTPRYDEAAANLAWSRTLSFFNAYLT